MKLCCHCRHFNGVNYREICVAQTKFTLLRGTQVVPRFASNERSAGFLGLFKGRCGPDGALWEPWERSKP